MSKYYFWLKWAQNSLFLRHSSSIPGLESPLLFEVPFSDLLSDLTPASEGASDGAGTLSGGAAALSLPTPSVGGTSPCVDWAAVGCSPRKRKTLYVHKNLVLSATFIWYNGTLKRNSKAVVFSDSCVQWYTAVALDAGNMWAKLYYGIVLGEEFWTNLLRSFEIPITVPQCNLKQHRHRFVRNHKTARVMSAEIRTINIYLFIYLLHNCYLQL